MENNNVGCGTGTATLPNPFSYMKPKDEETTQKIQELREQFAVTLNHMQSRCPQSRELTLAIIKLEECSMWAIKSIVFHQGEVQ